MNDEAITILKARRAGIVNDRANDQQYRRQKMDAVRDYDERIAEKTRRVEEIDAAIATLEGRRG